MLKHKFVSTVADGSRTEQVQPQRDWNDEHIFSGGIIGSLPYRDTAQDATGAGISWLDSVATGRVLASAGVGVAPAWSTAPTVTSMTASIPDIRTTSTDGAVLVNPTAATALVTVQYSPRLRFTGTAWNSGGAASETDSWMMENRPVTVAGTTTSALFFARSIAGGAYSDIMNLNSGGSLTLTHKLAVSDSTGEIVTGSGGFIYWLTRTVFTSPSDGVLKISNNAETDFSRVQFGGITSSFPALKRSAATLQARLADDSAYASMTVESLTANTALVATTSTTTATLSVTSTATVTTSLTTPLVIGGTGTTSTLTFQPTSGVGTTGADIIFKNGNNGATEQLRLTHAGLLTFGGTSASFSALKSTTTNINVRLADDSGDADLNARSITSKATSGTGLAVQAGAQIFWQTRTTFFSPADAQLKATNFAATAGVLLDFATDAKLKLRGTAGTAGTGDLDIGHLITAYNQITTAGFGLKVCVAHAAASAQSAANASVATYTVGGSDGVFEVSMDMSVTVTTTLVTTMTCTYTDVSNTARTMIFPVQQLSGSFIAAGAVTGLGVWETPVMRIRCKAGTAITLLTSAGTFTGVTYSTSGSIHQLGLG